MPIFPHYTTVPAPVPYENAHPRRFSFRAEGISVYFPPLQLGDQDAVRDLAEDGGGGVLARFAVLHEHDHRIFRGVRREVARKPRVYDFALLHARLQVDARLGGGRLAARAHAGDRRLGLDAAAHLDVVDQRLPQDVGGALGKDAAGGIGRRMLIVGLPVVGEALDEPGRHRKAAVGRGGHHLCDLDGSGREGALSEGEVCDGRVALELRVGGQGPALGADVVGELGGAGEADLPRHRDDVLAPVSSPRWMKKGLQEISIAFLRSMLPCPLRQWQ